MNGIKIKGEPVEFPMLMYFLNTLFIGAAICMIIVLLVATKIQKDLIQQLAIQQDQLVDTISWYKENMETTQDSFHAVEGRLTRMEHMMHIPRGERLASVRVLDELVEEE